MSKGLFSKAGLAISLFLFSFVAQAALSHLSINSRQFELGQHPKFKLNIVAGKNDLSRISFHVRQHVGDKEVLEELMVQPVNGFMLYAIGVDDVKDPNAKLIVSHYKGNNWQQFSVIPVFDAPFIKTNSKTEININTSNQPKKVAPMPQVKSSQKNQLAVTAPKPSKPQAQVLPATMVSSSASELGASCIIERNSTETLWRIASRYAKPWETNVYAVMLAIFEANPQAFSKQKIYLIRQDIQLVCPTVNQLNQYLSKAEDKLAFEALDRKQRSH
ncbi:FimV/HubP family polar landmark protein [Shewanella donghaensis]|uniref:FimV/HubP family polar landmark protein n=1 Tax=Shewanella donghaensis TaxID=238836 RepID=UPI0011838142|nr:FimV/HubP family polar landmark protein [Shewanella donghaensis]